MTLFHLTEGGLPIHFSGANGLRIRKRSFHFSELNDKERWNRLSKDMGCTIPLVMVREKR
jgi:hypothetical protein